MKRSIEEDYPLERHKTSRYKPTNNTESKDYSSPDSSHKSKTRPTSIRVHHKTNNVKFGIKDKDMSENEPLKPQKARHSHHDDYNEKKRNGKPDYDVSYDETSDASMPRKNRLLPDKFNGSTSVEAFLAQYEACARYNKWKENDKLAHLCWCLSGPASQILWDVGPSHELSYKQLVQKVRQRFGNEGQEERFQAELRTRKRKRGESLQILHQDIRRLMSLAYPGETSRFSELLAKDSFLSALEDPQFELKCREHEPKDLGTALRVAMRLEKYEKAVGA